MAGHFIETKIARNNHIIGPNCVAFIYRVHVVTFSRIYHLRNWIDFDTNLAADGLKRFEKSDRAYNFRRNPPCGAMVLRF